MAVVHQRLDFRGVFSGKRSVRVDEVQVLSAHARDVRVDARKRFEQAGLTEIGKGRSAGETREVGHGLDVASLNDAEESRVMAT